MSLADLPLNCGDTLQKNHRLQSQRVSRSGLVYGSSFSRGSCLDGKVRRFVDDYEDMWYDAERFQLDHINEVLTKLNDGSLDDEIWGKIVVMERCKRVAKAYLRKTTVIVDGGDEEFDGKTLGFNFFTNPMRDEYTNELRAKIGDGVIIKMDNQGNIKAMARGSTPIFVQGWKDSKIHCISDKVIRNHGKLITKSATSVQSDEDRVVKIFDMRRFKQCVERDPYETDTDARNLLLKSCVRVALVKDGGATDPMKTPCWFMIINLVALDMLKTKLPSVCSNPILSSQHSGINESSRLSRIMSQVSIVPPSSNANLYSSPALTHILAAAMHQANHQHYAGNMSGQLAASSSAINMEQIAKLASTLSLANPNLMNGNYQSTSSSRRIRRSQSFSDSDESEMDNRLAPVKNTTTYSSSTTGSSSGISGFGEKQKRFGGDLRQQIAKSMDALHEQRKDNSTKNENNNDKYGKVPRPRLHESLFHKPLEDSSVKPWKSCASTTSDYDSNKEVFDSGSWSSNSRVSSKEDEHRSYSPSIPSDAEHLGNNDIRRNSAPHEIANAAAFIARQRKLIRRQSSTLDSSNSNNYKPVYTKRNTLPSKGSRRIRRVISRRDIADTDLNLAHSSYYPQSNVQKNANTARSASPKPMVPYSSTETEPQTNLRTAICIPIQRNHLAPSASGPRGESDDVNNFKSSSNSKTQIPANEFRVPRPNNSIPTSLEKSNTQQPTESREQIQFSRIRKESSTDSAASDVQFEAETAPLTRQPPIRRQMGSQGVGASANTVSFSKPNSNNNNTKGIEQRELNLPQSPPTIRVRPPIRTTFQQQTPKHPVSSPPPPIPTPESPIFDARSLRPWKIRREATTCEERIDFKSKEPSNQLQPNAIAMRTEQQSEQPQQQQPYHNGAFYHTKNGQTQNSSAYRMQRRISNKEPRNAMSNEQQPSFRERATTNNPTPTAQSAFSTATTTPIMAPTIHRWLSGDKNVRHSTNMDSSNSHFPKKAAATTSIWRPRNGPWDELLGKREIQHHHQQQPYQRRKSTHMGLENQGSQQISTIPNLSTATTTNPAINNKAATAANVRSLRNYYTDLQHQQQQHHSWNQQQSTTLSSTMLTPRMKRLQSQQFYHHSHHRSMDINSSHSKEIKQFQKLESSQSKRFNQFPTSPPLPPQRLASIVPPIQTSNYCIN